MPCSKAGSFLVNSLCNKRIYLSDFSHGYARSSLDSTNDEFIGAKVLGGQVGFGRHVRRRTQPPTAAGGFSDGESHLRRRGNAIVGLPAKRLPLRQRQPLLLCAVPHRGAGLHTGPQQPGLSLRPVFVAAILRRWQCFPSGGGATQCPIVGATKQR